MSKNITKYLRTIAVSEFSSKRCSRDCRFCKKYNGLYRCYLHSSGNFFEDIEGFDGYDDIDSKEYSDADTYGFKRTDGCLKVFGE